MPRNISVKKKKLPALSMAMLPSVFQRLGLGIRYPVGGGPEGSACLRAVVWKSDFEVDSRVADGARALDIGTCGRKRVTDVRVVRDERTRARPVCIVVILLWVCEREEERWRSSRCDGNGTDGVLFHRAIDWRKLGAVQLLFLVSYDHEPNVHGVVFARSKDPRRFVQCLKTLSQTTNLPLHAIQPGLAVQKSSQNRPRRCNVCAICVALIRILALKGTFSGICTVHARQLLPVRGIGLSDIFSTEPSLPQLFCLLPGHWCIALATTDHLAS